MAIKFQFLPKDKNKRYAHDKSLKLVKFILNHLDFLPYLCDCITTYTTVGSLDRINERGKNMFNQYINSLDFDDEGNYKYIDEFEKIFRDTYTIGENHQETTLGDIRGKVLEDLLEAFISPRYNDRSNPFSKQFETGCEIKINGKHLTIPSRETVDIAGWDGNIGEFYEAKVGPHRFKKDELTLLTLIKDEMDKLGVQSIVGCVSMKRTDAIVACIEQVKNEEKIKYNNNIKVYGKDNLLDLKECPLAIPA